MNPKVIVSFTLNVVNIFSTDEGEQENEDVLLEWFKLVNERNKLIRKEGEYLAQ